METNSIIISQMTPPVLKELFKQCLKSELEDFKKELLIQTAKDDLINREQVLELLQINASTLYHWQNKGKIQVYKFANKCYYKRSELINGLIPQKK
jgi:DNA-binding NtrC family response regulator